LFLREFCRNSNSDAKRTVAENSYSPAITAEAAAQICCLGKRAYFAADFVLEFAVSLVWGSAIPATSRPPSAAPDTAPSAAPAAALVNTVFKASLALDSIPAERFVADFRVLLVLAALFLAAVLRDFFAGFFLVVNFELEADLVDFFLVVFLVVITIPRSQIYPHEATLPHF
jgi:hypothetical protein